MYSYVSKSSSVITEADPATCFASSTDPIISIVSISTSEVNNEKDIDVRAIKKSFFIIIPLINNNNNRSHNENDSHYR